MMMLKNLHFIAGKGYSYTNIKTRRICITTTGCLTAQGLEKPDTSSKSRVCIRVTLVYTVSLVLRTTDVSTNHFGKQEAHVEVLTRVSCSLLVT